MRMRLAIPMLVVVAVTMSLADQAFGCYCGAARFRLFGQCRTAELGCCPQQCYTVMKTRRAVVYEPQCVTMYRTVHETVMENQTINCTRYVRETHYREVPYTVSRPVYEQHVRTVCGLPVGEPGRHSDAVMLNLIGDDVRHIRKFLEARNSCVHLYGKREIRAGRKMGHVTVLSPIPGVQRIGES